jgi:molecular chaperone GrpE
MTDPSPDEQLLRRFGEWMRETREEAARIDNRGDDTACVEREVPAAGFGLYRLVEEFTALRHEVKLQTKSSRGLDEQATSLAASLNQALEALRSVQPKEAQAAWTAGQGLARALAELDEALDRGRAQTEKAAATLAGEPGMQWIAKLDAWHAGLSSWRRWRHAAYYRELRELIEREGRRPRQATLLAALVDGYRLIQKRLTQTMLAEDIARIDTVGWPVDPERMVVVDVVDVADSPPGLVHDELRRGYTWKGRLLRQAEVRTTR